MSDLQISQLNVFIGTTPIISDVNFHLEAGKLVAVVGANGAGKSSLLKAMGHIVPYSGSVMIGGAVMADMTPRARARLLAYLPQSHEFAGGMRVRDMVALGRFAFGATATHLSADDRDAVANALAGLDCSHLADRRCGGLSGGERALVCLARVLAADTPVILVDEPVAALDPGRQFQVMARLSDLAKAGHTVVTVLHDLSLASQFADQILWLDRGRLVAVTDTSEAAIGSLANKLLGKKPHFAASAADHPAVYFIR